MAISKILREKVRLKYNGLCAYTGKPLDNKWQVDHMFPKHRTYIIFGKETKLFNHDSVENLFPSIRIINHYKRGEDLEGFRSYMMNFHLRLKRLPKTTHAPATIRRIEYMNEIANLFGITTEKPFSGKFYFENPELLNP